MIVWCQGLKLANARSVGSAAKSKSAIIQMATKIVQGNALTVLKTLKDNCIQTCVTSPPYWGLRDYGVEGQLGLEKSPQDYVAALVEIFHEVRRVLRGKSR